MVGMMKRRRKRMMMMMRMIIEFGIEMTWYFFTK